MMKKDKVFYIWAFAVVLFFAVFLALMLKTLDDMKEFKQLTSQDPIQLEITIKIQSNDISIEEIEEETKVKVEIPKTNRHSITRGSEMIFEATAYTDDVQSQGKWVGQTASGMKPQVGVVAVDPKVIPLGTKLYIEGYNNNDICIAGDTGGAIKGNRLDLFFDTREEALKFGRQKVKIILVE